MNKADFLKEYLAKQERAAAPAFVPPPPKGVTPEVVCPLCQGLGQLSPSGRKVGKFSGVCDTNEYLRTCILCEGRRVILDRSSERPKTWIR